MTGLYFDSAYVAKGYLNEPDGTGGAPVSQSARGVYTSALALAEMACLIHRNLREGTLTPVTARTAREQFLEDIESEVWILHPVTDKILRQVETLARGLRRQTFIRAGDAVHIVSAMDAGFREIWTNDPRLLRAAAQFGIRRRQAREKFAE